MALDNKQTRLTAIYKQLYQYRHLLKGAPPLTIDLDTLSDSQISDGFSQLNEELNNVIGFLLGLHGSSLPIKTMIDAVNKHYKKDDFWRSLLLDFIEIKQEIEEEIGFEFIWDRLDNKKVSRIKHRIKGLDFDDHSNYDALMNEIIDKVLKMRATFKKYV